MIKGLFGKHWYWYWLIIFISIIAACFIISIYSGYCFFSTILKVVEDWSAFLSAAAAGILAIVAFLAIRNANLQEALRRKHDLERESRDRKEHQLNEIIEWVRDVGKCGFATDPTEQNAKDVLVIGILNKAEAHSFLEKHRERFEFFFESVRWHNEYISELSNIFDKDLLDEINGLIELLNEHEKILHDREYFHPQFLQGNTIKVAKHNLKLDTATKKIMKEIADTKKRNIVVG